MKPKGGMGSADPARDAALTRLKHLGRLLDDRFAVPGTSWRFGLDGLLGLVPGVGDAVSAGLSAYILFEARRLGVPKPTLGRMVANVGIDLLVGAVPILGDAFDFAWKANRRNLDLVVRHLERRSRSEQDAVAAGTRRRRRGDDRA